MTSILVVDDDQQLRSVVVAELKKHGYSVEDAASFHTAMLHFASAHVDVLLTDLRMDGKDGIDLIDAVSKLHPGTRTILMSGLASARDYQAAIDLGAVRVLCKPFTPVELVEAIEHAIDCETGFRGSVHGLSLIDMLQMFHYARRSIVVRVESGVPAFIHIEDGEIVHAERGELQGAEALKALLMASSGAIKTVPPSGETPRTVTPPFEALLLDLLREIDEERPTRSSLPAADLNDAFAFAVDDEPSHDGTAEWQWLAALVREQIPGADVALVHRDGTTKGLVGDELTAEGIAPWCGSMRQVLARLCRDDPTCGELMGSEVGFAVFFCDVRETDVLLRAPLPTNVARHRFRTVVRRIESEIQRDIH